MSPQKETRKDQKLHPRLNKSKTTEQKGKQPQMAEISMIQEGVALFIGQTGGGKTTLINELMGTKYEERSSLNPSTNHVKLTNYFDVSSCRLLKLVDTIGFSDINKSNDQIFGKIKEYMQKSKVSYINELIIVCKCDRFSKQEENDLINFLKKLNEETKKYTSIAFTHCLQKEIDYIQFFTDIQHRELIKYVGKNIYFVDIDKKRKEITYDVLDMMKFEICDQNSWIHISDLFNGPVFGLHKKEAPKTKLVVPYKYQTSK
eukprot:TRINITY_DN3341_c0_g1_i1.p1 TRINITY_DN3341_c0_g1~~TRINITY_DN3341_c0_g1_i1.p1  ORF type:complete len:260 (-),score=90.79 TRINITY_DN3341_c0_g1_i1:50-829(-)